MRCPDCTRTIERVRVYSECWQIGWLDGQRIVDYESIEEITTTIAVRCWECNADVRELIEEL